MTKSHPPRPAGCTCEAADVTDADCELVQHLRQEYADKAGDDA